VEKQEKKNRSSQVRNFVLNYCQRNLGGRLPALSTIENLDAYWEGGALSQLEIDGIVSKISAAWRTKVWSERRSAETVKRVVRLMPDVNATFSKLLKEWGLEVSDGMNECILRAKEDVDREIKIRKEVREEWRQRLSDESDKAKKAILKRGEALKTVPMTARGELRKLRLEVGSLRGKLSAAASWINNDYGQKEVHCCATSPVDSSFSLIGVKQYEFAIGGTYEDVTSFSVKSGKTLGYLDDIDIRLLE